MGLRWVRVPNGARASSCWEGTAVLDSELKLDGPVCCLKDPQGDLLKGISEYPSSGSSSGRLGAGEARRSGFVGICSWRPPETS